MDSQNYEEPKVLRNGHSYQDLTGVRDIQPYEEPKSQRDSQLYEEPKVQISQPYVDMEGKQATLDDDDYDTVGKVLQPYVDMECNGEPCTDAYVYRDVYEADSPDVYEAMNGQDANRASYLSVVPWWGIDRSGVFYHCVTNEQTKPNSGRII